VGHSGKIKFSKKEEVSRWGGLRTGGMNFDSSPISLGEGEKKCGSIAIGEEKRLTNDLKDLLLTLPKKKKVTA